MEVVQTITLTKGERCALAEAFEVMDEMSEAIKSVSVYDICSFLCRNIEYEMGIYNVPEVININDL